MKRLVYAFTGALSLVLLAGAAHAFDPTPGRPRIGVLRAHETFAYERESLIQKTFHEALYAELRERGFEVYEVEATFDELSLDPDRDADWYIEVVPATADTVDYGGVGVATRHTDVTLGVLVSRVAAEAHVYRGRTLERVASESLAKKNTAVVPTSVGVGTRSVFAAIALPFIERAQVRGVARSAARELAARVTKVVREP